MSWVQRQMHMGADPRVILGQLIADDTVIPEGFDDLTLWKIIINILTEPPKRKRLPDVKTLSDVVELMKTSHRIMVLTGAGVSCSDASVFPRTHQRALRICKVQWYNFFAVSFTYLVSFIRCLCHVAYQISDRGMESTLGCTLNIQIFQILRPCLIFHTSREIQTPSSNSPRYNAVTMLFHNCLPYLH